ncbi:ankyrin repeat domain-containing protein 60 [Pelodytes ibericus]
MASARRGDYLQGRTPTAYHYYVKVKLRETGEKFRVSNCSHHMKMAELKKKLELVAGIPFHFQRLSYIDEGDMPDKSTFKFNGILPRGTISLSIWHHDGMRDLVKAAAKGDLTELMCLGVTADSSYNTPNFLMLNTKDKREWIASRANVALYIAAHRGHLAMTRFLLQNGANVLAKTPLGNSALHAAAAMEKCDCITELLSYGAAQAKQTNNEGLTAQNVARLLGHKTVERHIFFFTWRERSTTVHLKTHLDPLELFPHQKFDSKLKTWQSGTHAKRYMANLVHYTEFHGSSINSPRKKTTKLKSLNSKCY